MKQDLGAPFEAAELIAAVKKALGRIDILVNNAGIIRRNDLLDYSLEDWDAVNAVNLRAVFQLSQAAAAEMVRARGGRIIPPRCFPIRAASASWPTPPPSTGSSV